MNLLTGSWGPPQLVYALEEDQGIPKVSGSAHGSNPRTPLLSSEPTLPLTWLVAGCRAGDGQQASCAGERRLDFTLLARKSLAGLRAGLQVSRPSWGLVWLSWRTWKTTHLVMNTQPDTAFGVRRPPKVSLVRGVRHACAQTRAPSRRPLIHTIHSPCTSVTRRPPAENYAAKVAPAFSFPRTEAPRGRCMRTCRPQRRGSSRTR